MPALILELKDPNADYRREVGVALAAIGPDAKAAVPALIEHLGNRRTTGPLYRMLRLGEDWTGRARCGAVHPEEFGRRQ